MKKLWVSWWKNVKMDERVGDGMMDIWKDGWVNGWREGWKDEWMKDGWDDVCGNMYVKINGWMDPSIWNSQFSSRTGVRVINCFNGVGTTTIWRQNRRWMNKINLCHGPIPTFLFYYLYLYFWYRVTDGTLDLKLKVLQLNNPFISLCMVIQSTKLGFSKCVSLSL